MLFHSKIRSFGLLPLPILSGDIPMVWVVGTVSGRVGDIQGRPNSGRMSDGKHPPLPPAARMGGERAWATEP